MALDIEDLIIAPFREVVDRGKEAISNAEAVADVDHDGSRALEKAAKAVVKEGERALKRLQPLWDSQVEKYGDVFKNGMSKNEDIEEKRRKLEDLLYDFEDFLDVESFEEERFTNLQLATKSLALDVIDIIKRLKIDGVPINPPSKSPLFPPLPPLPPLPPHAMAAIKAVKGGMSPNPPVAMLRDSMGKTDSPQPSDNPGRTSRPPSSAGSFKRASDSRRVTPQGLSRSDTKISVSSSVAASADPAPPYPIQELHMMPSPLELPRPAISPVLSTRPPPRQNGTGGEHHAPLPDPPRRHERRLSLTSNAVSADGSQFSADRSHLDIPSFPMPTRTSAWIHEQATEVAETVVPSRGRPMPPPMQIPQSQGRETLMESAIPEDEVLISMPHTEIINFEPMSPVFSKLKRFSMEASLSKSLHSPEEPAPDSAVSMTPSTLGGNSLFSQPVSAVSTAPSSSTVSQKAERTGSVGTGTQAHSLARRPSAAASSGMPPGEFDEGLILAEDWTTVVSDGASVMNGHRLGSTISSRDTDCSIGPKSSLYQMKGFCNGAQAFKKGSHWDGVKKSSGYVAGNTTFVGRCIDCGYAHQYDELSMDMERDPKASFTQTGLRFRVRFLYKSHLITNKMAEAYYGCVFCAQTGSVVREGDATVFTSSDMLFRHLSHHPQPLPEVPGITVLYGKEIATDDLRLHNFDLHLIDPPVTSNAIPASVLKDITRLPVVSGTKTHVQKWGEKKLLRPDGINEKEMLQFFAGARIIGVEFHVRWGGKWGSGWHDGHWGVFPTKSVEFDKPRKNEMPPMVQPGSTGPVSFSVQARWKFDPKDAADNGWLAFDKGDNLTNIGWLYKDHWCWSGMNSRGKYGVFPRAYVLYDAVKEEAVRPGAPKQKKGGRSRLFGRRATVDSSAASSISAGSSSVAEILM